MPDGIVLIVSDAYPARLLDDYLAVAKRRHPIALYATVLRTRSVAARHLLARAVNRHATLDDLVAAARSGGKDVPGGPVNPAALADLAGAIALQNVLPDDVADGPALYDLALRLGGAAAIPPRHQGIHAQLVFNAGDREQTIRLLRGYRAVPGFVRATLELDLANPFNGGTDPNAWLKRLSALLPVPGLELSDDTGATPFDRLRAAPVSRVDDDAKVSVVVSAYHPDRALLTSVRSLLAQSWHNLEILVVDDGSPDEYDAILDECDRLDARVRVIKLAVNSGTYTARNTACDAATGEFITFHDSDDWAHPHRIATQVAPLRADPELMATISQALTVGEQGVVTKPGRALNLLCTPSLLFRREPVLARLGYFDPIRKAADTEFLRRIGPVFGDAAVLKLPEILTLMRQGAESLSRAEFRAGWKHPARVAYQSSYRPWHEAIKRGTADPFLDKDAARGFAVPHRFARQREPLPGYDVVLACDWRPFGGPQKSMIEEIAALTGAGRRVAILHLESFRHMTEQLKPLCAPIQDLINAGKVDQVLPTDEVDTTLLVLRYPPVLQFRAQESISVRPKRMVILANQAPSELDGTDVRYEPATCTGNARQLFGVDPVWYPQGPAVRAALESRLAAGELAAEDMPGIIADRFAAVPRTRFRSSLPVVGRHSRDDWTKWPVDAKTVLRLYPDSPEVDVRIMGGAKSAKKLLGTDELPLNWIVYQRGELDVRNFLHQLDFYVYYPHPNMIEAFGRSILEALAAGCVTLLPPHFEPVFADAAIYAEPHQVPGIITEHHADLPKFLAQSELARRRVRERFSHHAYTELVAPLLAPTPKPVEPTVSPDLTTKEPAS